MTTRQAVLGSARVAAATPGRVDAVCTVARGSYASSATRPVYTKAGALQRPAPAAGRSVPDARRAEHVRAPHVCTFADARDTDAPRPPSPRSSLLRSALLVACGDAAAALPAAPAPQATGGSTATTAALHPSATPLPGQTACTADRGHRASPSRTSITSTPCTPLPPTRPTPPSGGDHLGPSGPRSASTPPPSPARDVRPRPGARAPSCSPTTAPATAPTSPPRSAPSSTA